MAAELLHGIARALFLRELPGGDFGGAAHGRILDEALVGRERGCRGRERCDREHAEQRGLAKAINTFLVSHVIPRVMQ